jgi:hypothetical protein
MATAAASGQSQKPETQAAVREAVEQALTALRGSPATVGFLFVSSRHSLKQAISTAIETAPKCEFLACHTAGEFTQLRRTNGGVAVLLTTLDPSMVLVAGSTGVRDEPGATAERLTRDFEALKVRAAKMGAGLSTTVLLVDGLARTGERLVKEVLTRTRLFQQVVGGASGDDGKFSSTEVGTSKFVGTDGAVALHVFGRKPWGIGVDHGLSPRTRPLTVTRANGNVLHEIEQRPAIEVYRDYARTKGVELTDTNTSSFLIGNELGVFFLNELHHARAPVSVGPKGELNLVADIMQGAQVCILDGEPDAMVAAAGRAAEQARASLQGLEVAGVLVFDCICRGMILKEGFQNEIDAVARVFPGVPVAGFLTYGEIARFRGKLDGWHNTTTVVVAIPA